MEVMLQGLVLLVAGMGIVYLFLTLLVWVMNRSSAIVVKFNHILPDDEPKKAKKPRADPAKHRGDDAEIAVALAVAAARRR